MKVAGTRILQVLGASSFGGGTRHVIAVAGALIERGAEVDVLTTDDETGDQMRTAGLRVRTDVAMPGNSELWRAPVAARRLREFVARRDYGVVHSHTTTAGLVTRLSNIPRGSARMIHTVHGLAFGAREGGVRAQAVLGVERLLAGRTDAVICVNGIDADLLRRRGVSAVHVPNGVPVPPVQRTVSASSTDIGFVGRIAHQKGVDTLIESLAELPGIRAVICGTGPDVDDCTRQAERLGVADRITWTGHTSTPWDLVEDCDVIVVPSRFEGHSLAVLEAMARRHVVVASDIPGITESIAPGTAILVRSGGASEFAGHIRDALALSPERREYLATAARGRIADHFSEERMLLSYLDVVEEVLSR